MGIIQNSCSIHLIDYGREQCVFMAKRFEKYQTDALKLVFEESEHLTKAKKLELVRVTGLDMEQVSSWFNRKRARKRARESKGDLERINAELKQSLQECREREAKLQKELQESKRKEAEIESENQNLQRRLAIAEGGLQLHPLIRFINGDS